MPGLASLSPAGALSGVPDSSLPARLLVTRCLLTDLSYTLSGSLLSLQ